MSLTVFASFILICTSCSHIKRQVKPPQSFTGKGWLAWTPDEREGYVVGFIDGYEGGYLEACNAANDLDLFKDKLPSEPGDEHLTMVARSRCIARRHMYSQEKLGKYGADVQFYTSMITQLYEKHPDARTAPYSLLLQELMHDGGPENAEELYKAQLNQWPNARE